MAWILVSLLVVGVIVWAGSVVMDEVRACLEDDGHDQ